METFAIHIQRLTLADAAIYRAIRLESLREDPDAFSSTLKEEKRHALSWFAGRLAGGEVYGAFRGGELLGVAGLYLQAGARECHKAYLWGMYVRPEARGDRVGRRLCEAVIASARNQVEILKLSVVAENAAARRLYIALGFTEYGTEKRSLKQGDAYSDELLMALDLRKPEQEKEQQ